MLELDQLRLRVRLYIFYLFASCCLCLFPSVTTWRHLLLHLSSEPAVNLEDDNTGPTSNRTSPVGSNSSHDRNRQASFQPSGPKIPPGRPADGRISDGDPAHTSASSPTSAMGHPGISPSAAPGHPSHLTALRLPGPGYELESLPATPTMPDRYSTPAVSSQQVAFTSPFSRYPSRDITATPAISSDPMYAFRMSSGHGGAFFMPSDQSSVQESSVSTLHGSHVHQNSHSSLEESRSRSSDGEHAFSTIPDMSTSLSDSSLSSYWSEDPLLSPHAKEDSGYGLARPGFVRSDSASNVPKGSDIGHDTPAFSTRLRNHPALRLHDDSLARSANAFSDRASLATSGNSSYFDLTAYQDDASAAYPMQENLTPRMAPSAAGNWPSEQTRLSEVVHDHTARIYSRDQLYSSSSSENSRRQHSFPSDPSYAAAPHIEQRRVLRPSFSVRRAFVQTSLLIIELSCVFRRCQFTATRAFPSLRHRGKPPLFSLTVLCSS